MPICIPQSLFNWNFRVEGLRSGTAEVTFDFFTEQGTIALARENFLVRKHGVFSGRWTLETRDAIHAKAWKPNALFRHFEVQAEGVEFELKAPMVFSRRYEFLSRGRVIGTIRPQSIFLRKAFMDCDASIPDVAQVFSFWLVALTWRRAARNNNGSSSSN